MNQLDAPDNDKETIIFSSHNLFSVVSPLQDCFGRLDRTVKKKWRWSAHTSIDDANRSIRRIHVKARYTYSDISSWMIWGGMRGRIFFTRRLISKLLAASTVGGVVAILRVQSGYLYTTVRSLERNIQQRRTAAKVVRSELVLEWDLVGRDSLTRRVTTQVARLSADTGWTTSTDPAPDHSRLHLSPGRPQCRSTSTNVARNGATNTHLHYHRCTYSSRYIARPFKLDPAPLSTPYVPVTINPTNVGGFWQWEINIW